MESVRVERVDHLGLIACMIKDLLCPTAKNGMKS